MNEVTQILRRIESGESGAAEELLPIVYEELRKLATARMATERPDHTLQATALVHEAYLRLVDVDEAKKWANRAEFFAASAEAMRRILVDSVRSKRAAKRGGNLQKADSESLDFAAIFEMDEDLFLDLEGKLAELEKLDPEVSELAKLHLFAGLSIAEAGELLGLSRTSAYKSWRYGRSWLQSNLAELND